MLDEPLPAKQRERAGIALASAESLLEILNDILDFSKLEAQQIRIIEEPVDIRGLVAEVIALMAAGSART
jgi:signal transduction histidine kinase